MLKLGYHGGLCCGIKVISGFYEHPYQANQPALEKQEWHGHNPEGGSNFPTGISFFDQSAPEETGRERLKRFIEFVDNQRPGGMIEVVLATGHYNQIELWEPLLLNEHGFKKVTTFINSNSSETCHVYHRTTDNFDPDTDDGHYPCGCCRCCGCNCED